MNQRLIRYPTGLTAIANPVPFLYLRPPRTILNAQSRRPELRLHKRHKLDRRWAKRGGQLLKAIKGARIMQRLGLVPRGRIRAGQVSAYTFHKTASPRRRGPGLYYQHR